MQSLKILETAEFKGTGQCNAKIELLPQMIPKQNSSQTSNSNIRQYWSRRVHLNFWGNIVRFSFYNIRSLKNENKIPLVLSASAKGKGEFFRRTLYCILRLQSSIKEICNFYYPTMFWIWDTFHARSYDNKVRIWI